MCARVYVCAGVCACVCDVFVCVYMCVCRALSDCGPRLKNTLTRLDLSGCSALTEPSFHLIGTKFSKLTHLNLTDCVGLHDNAVERLCDLAALQSLVLAGCPNVTDDALAMVGGAAWERLVHLDVRGCVAITDVGIQQLCVGVTSLRSLRLAHCHLLTDEAVYHVTFTNRLLQASVMSAWVCRRGCIGVDVSRRKRTCGRVVLCV